MIRICCLLLFSSLILAQDIENILERNPFDPLRGKVEEEAVDPEVVEEIPVSELPLLDGTIIIGEKKFAIFSTRQRGELSSKRIALNTSFDGYKLVHVDKNFVELLHNQQTVKVALYSGGKTNRGKVGRVRKKPNATGNIIRKNSRKIDNTKKIEDVNAPKALPADPNDDAASKQDRVRQQRDDNRKKTLERQQQQKEKAKSLKNRI